MGPTKNTGADQEGSVAGSTPHAVELVVGAIKGLGTGGSACVLWTIVMTAALLKGDSAVINRVWPDLYVTWLVVVGFWFVTQVIVVVRAPGVWSAAREFVRKKNATQSDPSLADPPAGEQPQLDAAQE